MAPFPVAGQEAPPPTRVRLWISAEVAVLQEGATEADVDRLMALLAPGAVYEHPRVGARVEGRDAIRAARVRFLGATRNARMSELSVVEGVGVDVVSMVLTMDARTPDGWRPVERRTVVILEHADDSIRRIIDYW